MLLESFPNSASKPVILLTIDLTQAVASEAISKNASLIISYHPTIFRPLRSITQSNTQQRSLLRLAQAGISVYSPHTSVDAAVGGVNDWLCNGISGGTEYESGRSVIEKAPGGNENEGYGRVVHLKEPVGIKEVVDRVKKFLELDKVNVAIAERHRQGETISKIGVCAGSGGGVFGGLEPVDLLFTGELSHHEALAAVEKDISVISCFHSNTERGYLRDVMKEKLLAQMKEDGEDGIEVVISEKDKDPYTIL